MTLPIRCINNLRCSSMRVHRVVPQAALRGMQQMRRIYMDNNATTPVLPEVVDAMQPFWSERFGNASAVHEHGRNARAAVDEAREQVASLLEARAAEITFTGGGTESDNQALFGVLSPGQHLITSLIEHHAVLHAAEELERRGVEVTFVDCDSDGIVGVEAVRQAMRPNTMMVSVMLANNETGVLQPVQAIAQVAHQQGALMHTDAIQCCGKNPVSVRELRCDMLSVSAHKMHAPQGVGALWMRRGIPIKPLLHGGPHERQKRAGTENVPGIVAFGEAAQRASSWIQADGPVSLQKTHRAFEAELLRRIPEAVVHGSGVARLPNTTSVRFDGVDAEALVIALDLKGLAISGGSACTSGAVEPSHVLLAMGLRDEEARSTVRISLSRRNTAEEVEIALDLLEAAVARLRAVR